MVNLNIGIVYYKIGKYADARVHLEQSLRHGIKIHWLRRQCFANIALGNVHRLQMTYESARRHLHTAYAQAQELEYPREEALALEFLGDVYRDEGQYADALRFYARAMAIAEKQAPEGDIVMEVHRRRGECLTAQKNAEAAIPDFERALELARVQGDRFEEGATLREMARAVLDLGDPASARRWLDASVTILDDIGARHEHGISLMASAELALSETETGASAAIRRERLDAAWRDATAALDRMLQVDVSWWTEQARHLVGRVGRLRAARARAERSDRQRRSDGYEPGDIIIHASRCIRDLLQITDMFATSSEPVLITGETGTGKELFARRVHENSERTGPLVTVNVAAIPETMFEREFFGHVRGAFSGADRDGEGFAARANGGTLFLDEIGDLPLAVQPKLLRLLQEGTYQAIGDPTERRTDIRLVAATNADLNRRVAEERFREDLWYRLRILELDLPPIRDRREDILPLLRHFLCTAARRHVDLSDYFDLPSLEAAERWDWPGNVREIAMVAHRAQVARQSGAPVHFELEGRDTCERLLLSDGRPAAMAAAAGATVGITESLPSDRERARIRRTLDECHGSRSLAAARLGIGRSTLYRRMEKLGIPTRKS